MPGQTRCSRIYTERKEVSECQVTHDARGSIQNGRSYRNARSHTILEDLYRMVGGVGMPGHTRCSRIYTEW